MKRRHSCLESLVPCPSCFIVSTASKNAIPHFGRRAGRQKAFRVEAGGLHGRGQQQLAVLARFAARNPCGLGRSIGRQRSPRVHLPGAPACGNPVPSSGNGEHHAMLLAQRHLVDADAGQPIGAGAFEKLQVACVIDHAAGVRVFPVDAVAEEGLQPHRIIPLRNCAEQIPTGAPCPDGGFRPRCARSESVAMRPRAVRIR
jgi:hypothetical protein